MTSFHPSELKQEKTNLQGPQGTDKLTVPDPSYIVKAIELAEMEYRYNLITQEDEFKIDDKWQMDAPRARSNIRASGESIIPTLWKQSLELIRARPENQWHPWKALGPQTYDLEPFPWLAYAVIQKLLLGASAPYQPIFVIERYKPGQLVPTDMMGYENHIFNIVVPTKNGRTETVSKAKKSNKVSILPTARMYDYDDDENFYLLTDALLPDFRTLDIQCLWADVYQHALNSPYLVAVPDVSTSDEPTPILPTSDEIVRDLIDRYSRNMRNFGLYDAIGELYLPNMAEDVRNDIFRRRFAYLIQQVSQKLRAQGFTNNRAKWFSEGMVNQLIEEANNSDIT